MTNPPDVAPPGDTFNFAQHLLQLNERRAARTAYVDDYGTLTYGELDDRVRRMAAGLRSLGVKREERVLLLMHDCNDWPVSFLGALYAGVVPVAVSRRVAPTDEGCRPTRSPSQTRRSPAVPVRRPRPPRAL